MANMMLASGLDVWVPNSDWKPKVVAVDEDGTFLSTSNGYDVERFEALWPRLFAFGTRFVVASGNQYWQIRDLFARHADEIAYVAANGAYVEDIGGTRLFAAAASPCAVAAIIDEMHHVKDVPLVMSGVASAYVERGTDPAFVEVMSQYFHRLAVVDDLAQVDDQVFMFSGRTSDADCRTWMSRFSDACDGAMTAVYSGDGYFDLVVPGVTKASGLAMLCEHWGVDAAEVAAFGDSENDLEMLDWAGAGYAMGNAGKVVKDAAKGLAPANVEHGVLQLLEAWFAQV